MVHDPVNSANSQQERVTTHSIAQESDDLRATSLPKAPRQRLLHVDIKNHIYSQFRPELVALTLCRHFSNVFTSCKPRCETTVDGDHVFMVPWLPRGAEPSMTALLVSESRGKPVTRELLFEYQPDEKSQSLVQKFFMLRKTALKWRPDCNEYDFGKPGWVTAKEWRSEFNLRKFPDAFDRVRIFEEEARRILEVEYLRILEELEDRVGTHYLAERLQFKGTWDEHVYAVVDGFKEWDKLELRSALRAFARSLDQEVAPFLIEDGMLVPEKYNFLVDADSGFRENRLRWYESFPGFRFLLTDISIGEAIDSGEKIIPKLANKYGVSSGFIKKIKRAKPEVLKKLSPKDPSLTVSLLSRCKLPHLPELDSVERDSVVNLGVVIEKTLTVNTTDVTTGTVIHNSSHMIANVSGKWEAVARKIKDANISQVLDFLDAFARRTVFPPLYFHYDRLKEESEKNTPEKRLTYDSPHPKGRFTDEQLLEWLGPYDEIGMWDNRLVDLSAEDRFLRYQSISRKILLSLFSKEWHVGQLANASLAWHRTFGRNPEDKSRGLFVEWPAICNTVVAPNGCIIVPLNSSAELSEEGREMSHCVGRYSSGCRAGRYHIFSIRDKNGK